MIFKRYLVEGCAERSKSMDRDEFDSLEIAKTEAQRLAEQYNPYEPSAHIILIDRGSSESGHQIVQYWHGSPTGWKIFKTP